MGFACLPTPDLMCAGRKSNATQEVLVESWRSCERARAWVERSYKNSPAPPYESLNEEDWDQLEALSGRFARLVDLIVHKLFRALDRYEFEETISLLDSANRAVKRGLVENVDELRDLKDIRNEIVHEYSVEDVVSLHEDIYNAAPGLIALVGKIGDYMADRHGIY